MENVCQVTSESIYSGYCKNQSESNFIKTPDVQLRKFGTYENPFSVDSLWNSRPSEVVFGDFVIPESDYHPLVGEGDYSSSVFRAVETDSRMTVYPPKNKKGIWDPDAEENVPFIKIPHWPSETVPAKGTDGHCEIVDASTGLIHSFWQLRNEDGVWRTEQYSWSRIDGTGWGTASRYYIGARAAGVPSMAGMIRKHEINDGQNQYFHALAMSLDFSGLSGKVQYVFPATSGDRTYHQNTGEIPEGALLMLPPDFDENSITNLDLRKVVKTLKTFGAYPVDRNHGTPFYIYVENGSGYTLHPGGWNPKTGDDLQSIRKALRQVTNAKGWLNGEGKPLEVKEPMNLISMRGPWKPVSPNGKVPRFNTDLQAVVFDEINKTDPSYFAENASGNFISKVHWAKPIPGKTYRVSVECTQGAHGYLRFWGDRKEQFNTGLMGNGMHKDIVWPSVIGIEILGVVSKPGEKSWIRVKLTEVV